MVSFAKRKIKTIVWRAVLGLILTLPVCGQSPIKWLPRSSKNIELNGLPWYGENRGELFRLPIRLKDQIPSAVWDLARSPRGGRIRFRTDSSILSIRLE